MIVIKSDGAIDGLHYKDSVCMSNSTSFLRPPFNRVVKQFYCEKCGLLFFGFDSSHTCVEETQEDYCI